MVDVEKGILRSSEIAKDRHVNSREHSHSIDLADTHACLCNIDARFAVIGFLEERPVEGGAPGPPS